MGAWVVVPVEEEEDLGVLTSRPLPLSTEWEDLELPRIIGLAPPEEVHKALEMRAEREPTAIKLAYEKVREHNLEIKMVTAFYYHRTNKMKFYFCSENRIDFRDLVKDLAHLFHARIELRQIGVRDAAGMVGGYGLCGQELCCSRFLKGFDPITIKMAKDQNLALNPSKISGCCGRLLCCLKYEHLNYVEAQRYYPRIGAAGKWEDRYFKVVTYNLIKETVGIQAENQVLEIPLSEYKLKNPDWRNAPRYSQMGSAPPPAGKSEPPEPVVEDYQEISYEDDYLPFTDEEI
jgi:cell fate regulator YaaT (PSP1 superfamily)